MVPRWAIVIGIDDYRDEQLRLHGAVRDAVRFGRRVTSDEGSKVPHSNCRLLLGRHADDRERSGEEVESTKDIVESTEDIVEPTKGNIVKAINEVVAAGEAEGQAEQLYF